MNSLENLNRPNTRNENKSEATYEKGRIKCEFTSISDCHRETAKAITDNFGQYLDHDILIKYRNIPVYNPGLHGFLQPEFKSPGDRDNITVNTNFWDKSMIDQYAIHELGHAFEGQLINTAAKNNLNIFPEGMDVESDYFEGYQFGEFQSDLFVGLIFNPKYVENNLNSPILKNTYKAFKLLFKNNDFAELRAILEKKGSEYKKTIENNYILGKDEKPAWLEDGYKDMPIYERAFDENINNQHKEYFDRLDERFRH